MKLRGEKRSPQELGDTPYIGLEHVEPHTSRLLGHARADELKSSGAVFSEGELLYSRLRPYLNKVWAADRDGIASAEFLVLQAVGGSSMEFVRRRIMADDFLAFTASLDKGDRPRVDYDQIRAFSVAVPPLREQRRIVTKLDTLTARTARARADLDRIPALAARYKQAVLTKAFSGDLTALWRVSNRQVATTEAEQDQARKLAWSSLSKRRGKYEPAEIAGWEPDLHLPETWRWASVDELTSMVQYGSSAKTSDEFAVPVLRMGNIVDGLLDLTKLKYLPADHDEFPELLLDDGDLLFNRTNSAELVGKTAVFRGAAGSMSFASYLIRLKSVGYHPELLAAYINSSFGRSWVATATSQQVGQANVNGTKLRGLGVPLMPPAEQLVIWERIRSAFAEIDRLTAEAAAARRLLDLLDQAVLAKAFRGELVPQDPADEPASVLLDRIRAERASAPKVKRGRRVAA